MNRFHIFLLAGISLATTTLLPAVEIISGASAADTRPLWREANVSPRNQGFHWNQNGETQYLIGKSLGEGMKSLLGK